MTFCTVRTVINNFSENTTFDICCDVQRIKFERKRKAEQRLVTQVETKNIEPNRRKQN